MNPFAEIAEAELQGLTPARARELVVRCFYNAQKETFARAAKSLGTAPGEDAMKRMVEGAVRLAFRAVKADFEHPTKQTLAQAVTELATKAAAMGTPPDIIAHHKGQLGRLFAALPD